MQWTSEADLLLFKHLLKTHDVKVDYKVLADAMGNDITPKAITHRIGKIRSLPTSTSDGETPSTPAKPKASPKKPRAPRATKAGASAPKAKATGGGKGKKRGAATLADSDYEEGEKAAPDDDSTGSAAKKVKLGEKLDSSNEEDEEKDVNGEAET